MATMLLEQLQPRDRLDDSSRRVLLVSYPFPPVGGAGVQRTTKFVKYLPEFGWRPSVLTVANPSVPAWDQSLLKDIPADTVVRRARTWEPGYNAKAAVSTGSNGQSHAAPGIRGMMKAVAHRLAKMIL